MRTTCTLMLLMFLILGCDPSPEETAEEDVGVQQDSNTTEDTTTVDTQTPDDTNNVQDSQNQDVLDEDGQQQGITCTENPPVGRTSTQTVTFTLQNPSTEPIWVPTSGFFCDTWAIQGMKRNLGWECGCECPNPGPPHIERLEQLDPGETYTITWDARRLVPYTAPFDCFSIGWEGYICVQEGAQQPVEAGDYTFVVGALTALPTDCGDNGDGTASCGSQGGGFDELPPSVQRLCDDMSTASKTFALPASGDVDVDVDLTQTSSAP